jgi:hypothetical protein
VNSGVNASSASTQPENNDDDIFLKFNCKLADMIAEGKAALSSSVEVTDVEMMIAEEKEREERIMKEHGIQTIRRTRRLTNSSNSSDYDYYNSLGGSGGHSNQSSPSLCSSPTSYSADNGLFTKRPIASSPTQYGSPIGFNSFSGSFNGYEYRSPSTTNRYEGSSSSFGPPLHNFGKNSSGYGSNPGFGSSWICNNQGYY